jgi:putative ABC transport system permease protein
MMHYQRLLSATTLAAASLRAHKLRSFLTLLGVIVGVGSVVLVGAAIEGLGNYAEDTTSKVFGGDSFQIGQLLQRGRLSRRERIERLRYNRPVRREDYDYLRQVLGRQVLFSPYRVRAEDLRHEGRLLEASTIIGVAAAMAEIREISLTDGRPFTEQEERSRVGVAMIGEDVRQAFFGGRSAIGETIHISGLDFRVIGIQEKIGNAGGSSQDNVVYIPSTVFERLYGQERSMMLFARARPESGLTLDEALDLTRVALRTRYHARPGRPDNFDTLTPDTIREFIGQILKIIGAIVMPVTCMSLLVGGIVIMNIMLVSVTERTREIGLRRSLGARRADLMAQFLIEAMLLSLMGGLVGLTLGAAGAKLASIASGVRLVVTWPYVVVALTVSAGVGVASGWYPARRAARLDPVEALRAE